MKKLLPSKKKQKMYYTYVENDKQETGEPGESKESLVVKKR